MTRERSRCALSRELNSKSTVIIYPSTVTGYIVCTFAFKFFNECFVKVMTIVYWQHCILGAGM